MNHAMPQITGKTSHLIGAIMKLPRIFLVIPALLSFALAACNHSDNTPGAENSDRVDLSAAFSVDQPATPAGTASYPHDSCQLLTTSEVEAVLGSKLIGPPYLGSNPIGRDAPWPSDRGPVCWYVGEGNHSITVLAYWEDAGAVSAMMSGVLAKAEDASKGMVKLQDGTELTGDWDEARMRGCCNLMTILGDASVDIEFGGSLATPEQAGELANKALARLTQPLTVSGIAGNAAAQKREEARYTPSDSCAYWTVADVQRLLDTAALPVLVARGDDCQITFNGAQGGHEMSITVTPRNGYRTFRNDNASYGGFARSISNSNDGSVQLKSAVSVEGPWEAAENGPMQFNAVRHDASIALRQGGMSMENIRAIIGHAFDRIDAGVQP